MKSSVEPQEDNKVKLNVEVDETEFDKDLDSAFRALAKDVKLPGFRKGKAPRKVLEARIGTDHARQEAFRTALPTYYAEAVIEHDVDVIAAPEFEIVSGHTEGPVEFDAVVQIRPTVEVDGYADLEVEVPSLKVTDKDIEDAIDQMRQQFSDLVPVDRASVEGDRIKMNLVTTHEGEEIAGMTTDDYVYEVGSGGMLPEVDEAIVGVTAGDDLEISAKHPDETEEEPILLAISVTEVQETVLPEPTDEWVKENSEFETYKELWENYHEKFSEMRINQGGVARRNNLAEAVAGLVEDEELPDAMVEHELENRMQEMAQRLQGQGLDFEQYLQFSGQSQEDFFGQLRGSAQVSAKVDLALRSIASTESIDVSEEELTEEFERIGVQVQKSGEEVHADFEKAGQLSTIKADILKSKTLEWLIDTVKMVDDEGNEVDPEELKLLEAKAQETEEPQTEDQTAEDNAE